MVLQLGFSYREKSTVAKLVNWILNLSLKKYRRMSTATLTDLLKTMEEMGRINPIAFILGERKAKESLPAFVALLRERKNEEIVGIANALGEIGESGENDIVVETLIQRWKEGPLFGNDSFAIKGALQRIGGAKATNFLRSVQKKVS